MRTQKEIDEVMDWVKRGLRTGGHIPTASYEQGYADAIRWLTGETDDRPDLSIGDAD